MAVKVVHLVTRLDLGGAQQNTLHTVRQLDRAAFEPVLVCGRGGMLDEEASADPSFRTVFVDSLLRDIHPFYDLLALLELAKLLLAEKPAVLHTHSSKAGILGRLAAALAGVPLVGPTHPSFGFPQPPAPLVQAL